MNVAVIPARGGSKRIPRKNIKEFCGKPMIAWPINIAQKSGLFEHILVSTDDDEIADVSRSCGAEVFFLRPAELSNDHAGIIEVIGHAVSWMQEQKWHPRAVCCIYATAPMIQIDDLNRGLDALNSGDWTFAFSVTEYAAPIFRSFQEQPDGNIEMIFPEHFETRSQDLPVALHDAAQFCWGKPHGWLSGMRVFDRNSYPVRIPRWRVQDIDTFEDWKRAEMLFSLIKRSDR